MSLNIVSARQRSNNYLFKKIKGSHVFVSLSRLTLIMPEINFDVLHLLSGMTKIYIYIFFFEIYEWKSLNFYF